MNMGSPQVSDHTARSKFGPAWRLLSTVLLITSFVAFSSARAYVWGVYLPPMVVSVMLGLFGLYAAYGFFLAFRSYRFDEERVSAHLFGRVRSMRWSDVTEFDIRRSGGDSTVRLRDAAGARLDIDFQLLGTNGNELFSVMTRQLQALIDAKLEKLGREGGRFSKRWLGFLSLPGGMTLSDGVLRKADAAVAVEEIREIRVRRLQKLGGGQEYEIVGESSSLRLQSYFHDVPLLLLFLCRKVPEEQWVVNRSEGFLHERLLGLALVVTCLPAACVVLAENAQTLASWSPAEGSTTEATVQAVFPTQGRLWEVVYEAGEGDDMFTGSVQVLRTTDEALPAEGSTITIAYDPDRPYRNIPVGSLKPYKALPELLLFAVFLGVMVLFAISMLLHKPAEDPFLSWLHN